MYYFIEKENVVEKYSVSFDKEELEKLKIQIINNCSEIEHFDYEACEKTYGGPNKFDYLRFRNYKEVFVGISESRDTLQMPDRKIYHYTYDKYKFPKIVNEIDKLLNGDVSALDNIYYNETKGLTVDEKIMIISNELDEINNLEVDKKINKINELKRLLELKELNKNQQPIEPYYEKVKKLITMTLVDTISKEEIEKVHNFFEDDFNKENKKTLKKLLQS